MDENDRDELWEYACSIHDSDEDSEQAISLFNELSDTGDYRASNMLGYIFESKGIRNKRDNKPYKQLYAESVRWFRLSETQKKDNNTGAHFGLARHYFFGLGEVADYKLAAEHLRQSDLDGDPLAQLMMAEMCYSGQGVAKDVNTAKILFKEVASAGYIVGLVRLRNIAKKEKKYLIALSLRIRLNWMLLKIVLVERDTYKLTGIGGKYGSYQIQNRSRGKYGIKGVRAL